MRGSALEEPPSKSGSEIFNSVQGSHVPSESLTGLLDRKSILTDIDHCPRIRTLTGVAD